MPSESNTIYPSAGLRDYFRERVVEATGNQQVDIGETTEFYLVNLLAEFSRTQSLFDPRTRGRKAHEPLALIWKRASESMPGERVPILKRLGDLSLYFAGYFHASLSRSLVDVDYYIGMGGSAYDAAASLIGGQPRSDVFVELYRELAEKFADLVDVLSEVAETGGETSNETDILRLYERWLKTRSPHLAQRLSEAGVIPSDGVNSGVVH